MSHRARHLDRPEPVAAPPRFRSRDAWERMTATERARIRERTARRGEPAPDPEELTAADVAVLLPLARRAAVDDMARRLHTPTTEEDQR